MITTTSSIIDFEKAERDFLFLLHCFQEVLRDLGESDLADHLPWQNAGKPLEEYPDNERALQAFSIFFQLLNMAEENSAAQNRRALEAEQDWPISPDSGAEHFCVSGNSGFQKQPYPTCFPRSL